MKLNVSPFLSNIYQSIIYLIRTIYRSLPPTPPPPNLSLTARSKLDEMINGQDAEQSARDYGVVEPDGLLVERPRLIHFVLGDELVDEHRGDDGT